MDCTHSFKRLSRTLAVSTFVVGAAVGNAQAAVVRIGVLAPLTGPSASDGREFVNGVQWAVDEANAAGGSIPSIVLC